MGIFDRFRKATTSRHRKHVTYVRAANQHLDKRWYNVHRAFLTSPNTDVRQRLEPTRRISRHVCATNCYASRYLDLMAIYTIGEGGIQISPTVTRPDGSLDTDINDRIKHAWNDWANEHVIHGRTSSLTDVLQSLVRTLGRDGEAVYRLVTGPNVNKYGIALYPIDPVALDSAYNVVLPNKNPIIMGIEFEGVHPIAYHCWPNEIIPGTPHTRERLEQKEVLHIFDDDFSGLLVRGMPWTAPALDILAKLDNLMDAYLESCQIAAYTPFKKTTALDTSEQGYTTQDETDEEQAEPLELTFNSILDLAPGVDIQPLDVKFPDQGYPETIRSYLQAVSMALMVSYASLVGDHGNESYASGRLGSIIERDHYKTVSRMLCTQFLNRIYRAWLKQATLSGALELPDSNLERYYSVSWITRSFSWIDPTKDAKSLIDLHNHGLKSLTQIAAELGGDFRETLRLIKEEHDLAASMGITLPLSNTPPPPLTEDTTQALIERLDEETK